MLQTLDGDIEYEIHELEKNIEKVNHDNDNTSLYLNAVNALIGLGISILSGLFLLIKSHLIIALVRLFIL